MPLVLAAGIDPVHFGLVVTLNLGIGQQTPPRGQCAGDRLLRRQGGYLGGEQGQRLLLAVLVAMLLMVTYLPAIPMWPVELFYR